MRSRSAARRLALLAIVVTFVGCGGGADDEARKLNKRSVISDTHAVEQTLIRDDEIAKAPTRTPERALLAYWMSLQYEAWDNATSYYAADLRKYLGDDRLMYSLRNQASHFQSTRPTQVTVTDKDDRSITRFLVKDVKGKVTPLSLSWQRQDGEWKIVHDPYLDTALAQARQLDVQMAVDPTSQTPSKEALRAAHAASKLQDGFAASQQDTSKRAGTSPAG